MPSTPAPRPRERRQRSPSERQRAAQELLAQPGAEIIGSAIVYGGTCLPINLPTLRSWVCDGWVEWNRDARCVITPAGRTALRASAAAAGAGGEGARE